MQQARYYGWVIVFAALALNVLCFGGLALGLINAETVFRVDLSPENIKQLGKIAPMPIDIEGFQNEATFDAYGPNIYAVKLKLGSDYSSGQPQITSPAGMKGAVRQGDVGEGHKPTFPDTRPAYGRAYAGVAQRDD